MGTTQKKKASTNTALSQEHPLAARKTLYSLENKQGKIVALDTFNFGITTGVDTVLLAVNLPAQLKKVGSKVIFSGAVKEIDPTEFWAATPIVLTKAEIIK